MARPKKITVDYFPHYCNHGKTIYIIEDTFGNDGYAFWFKVLELLGNTENHYLDCNKQETWRFMLAKTRFNEVNANKILSILSDLDAIDKELWSKYRIIWSKNFINNLETVYQRRNINPLNKAGLISLCLHKPPSKEVSVNINTQSKVKYSKEKKDPRIKNLVDFFYNSVIQLKSFKPKISKSDASMVQSALKDMSLEEIQKAIEYFITSPKADKGITLSICLSTHSINLFRQHQQSTAWQYK